MGGTADAATGMLNDLIKPLSVPLPPERICDKLNKKDSQICELKYGMSHFTENFKKTVLSPAIGKQTNTTL